MIEEDDSMDILQEILQSKILDWDPQHSKIMEIDICKDNNKLQDAWNTDDDDDGGLSVAITNCKIVDGKCPQIETSKRRRGRPRKRAIQRRAYIYSTPIDRNIMWACRCQTYFAGCSCSE
jgi:hypothetical protein